jgi:hypothetical protein
MEFKNYLKFRKVVNEFLQSNEFGQVHVGGIKSLMVETVMNETFFIVQHNIIFKIHEVKIFSKNSFEQHFAMLRQNNAGKQAKPL